MLRYLDSSRFDVHLIVFNQDGMDEAMQLYPGLTHHLVSEADLAKSIADVRGLDLDIIINTTSLSGRFYNPIAALLNYRVAPIQLTSCADVITTGIASIDWFLMGETYINADTRSEMLEPLLPCRGIGFYVPVPPPVANEYKAERAKLNIRDEEVLFVSTAQLFKLTPDLLKVWLDILEKVPGSKILVMPFNSEFVTARFGEFFLNMRKSMCERAAISEDRIIIAQARGRSETMAFLKAGDVYLDSFPYCGATSLSEALHTGLPSVTLSGQFYRCRLSAGLLQELSLTDLIAHSFDDYVNISVDLAVSRQKRDDVRGRIGTALKTASFHDARVIADDLARNLEELAHKSPLQAQNVLATACSVKQ